MAGRDPHHQPGAAHEGNQPAADQHVGQPVKPDRAPSPASQRRVHDSVRDGRDGRDGRDLVALNRREPAQSPPPPPPAPEASDVAGSATPGADALDPDRILELPPRRAATTRGAQDPGGEPARPPRIVRILPARPAGAPVPASRQPSGRRSGPAAGSMSGSVSGSMVALREAAEPYLASLSARRTADEAHATGGGNAQAGKGALAGEGSGSHAKRAEGPASPPACPICHDAGFVRLDVPLGDKLFGQAVRCECKEREIEARERQKLRDLSSLKPFDKKTFATFDATVPGVAEAFEVARRYADDPSGWLILQGVYGCGKTHLAAGIARMREEAGETVFFSIVPDLLDHLRATFAPASEITYDELFDRVRHVGLLVLDDLGSENATAWATEKLFQIINYRYNYRLPTVITTNVRLLSHLDERIRSRLSDLSLVRWVTISAGDYRERHVGQGGNTRPPRGSSGTQRRPSGYGR